MSLKRAASSEGVQSEDGVPEAKIQKHEHYFVLEPDCQQSSGEDSDESVRSLQGKETDCAKDTSDGTIQTEWSSEDSCSSAESIEMNIEYEVESLSEKENPLGNSFSSSGSDDIVCAAAVSVVNLYNEELSSFADSSGNSDSNSMFDPEIPRADYWTCLQCKNKKNNPLFRYCEKCFKLRKNFFPPRPQRKKKRRRKNSNKKAPSLEKSVSTASTVSLGETSQENVDYISEIAGPAFHLDSGLGSSQDLISQDSEVDSQEVTSNSTEGLSSQMCITCMTNPMNGIFVHKKIGHVCCCYKCALKVWEQNRKCPLCNCKVSNILKLIVQ